MFAVVAGKSLWEWWGMAPGFSQDIDIMRAEEHLRIEEELRTHVQPDALHLEVGLTAGWYSRRGKDGVSGGVWRHRAGRSQDITT